VPTGGMRLRRSELPGWRLVCPRFFSAEVFRDVQPLKSAGENQLDSASRFSHGGCYDRGNRAAVMAYDLEQVVGAVDIGEYEVEHGVDPVLAGVAGGCDLPTEPVNNVSGLMWSSAQGTRRGPPGFDSAVAIQGRGTRNSSPPLGSRHVLGGKPPGCQDLPVVE